MNTKNRPKTILKEDDLAENGIESIKSSPKFKELLYPLAVDQKAALRAAVQREGLLHPVDIDEEGTILDGHNRYEICMDLQAPLRYRRNLGLSEEEKVELIFSRNLDRRQTSPDQDAEARKQRMDNLFKLRKSDPKKYTYEEIGRRLNKDESTVRKAFENRNNPERKRPDARVKISKDKWPLIKQRHDHGASFRDLGAEYGVTVSTIKAIYDKETAKEQRQAFLAAAAEDFQDRSIDLRPGDFSEVLQDIGDGAIDAIITDPPYEKKSLADLAKLGELAARVLKPDGWLVAYVAHYYLPEVLDRLNQHLEYYWLGMVRLNGDCELARGGRNVRVRNRPFVIFRKKGAPQPAGNAFNDTIEGGKADKTYHPWQQPVEEFSKLIEMFTDEGNMVLDPFAGSGTTLIAARRARRHAIGAEIDPETYDTAWSRIAIECGELETMEQADAAVEEALTP